MQRERKSGDCEYGSETDVERITGRKRKTLQKDRMFGTGFPFYRFGRKILYDLEEVRDLIRAGRVDVSHSARPERPTFPIKRLTGVRS
jgi:hypothetical protein